MSMYFARYKGLDQPIQGIESCQRYYVRVQQEWLGKYIVVENEHFGWNLRYPNLDMFLRDWDDFEQDVPANDTVAGLVGI